MKKEVLAKEDEEELIDEELKEALARHDESER